MAETTASLFQDPEERQSFLRVLESSGGDPEAMDAPERWIENARAIDQIGQAAAFQAPLSKTPYSVADENPPKIKIPLRPRVANKNDGVPNYKE